MSGATRQATYRKKYPERVAACKAAGPKRRKTKLPLHIKALRTAYCDQFIKTGVFDPEIAVKLRKYVDECKAAKVNPRRIFTWRNQHGQTSPTAHTTDAPDR